MKSNPHYYPAQDSSGHDALVNAILAVAYEQRTSALITYMDTYPASVVFDGIDITVRERLGLKPLEEPNA